MVIRSVTSGEKAQVEGPLLTWGRLSPLRHGLCAAAAVTPRSPARCTRGISQVHARSITLRSRELRSLTPRDSGGRTQAPDGPGTSLQRQMTRAVPGRRGIMPRLPEPARRSTARSWSPVHLAVEHRDLPRMRDLLDAGHDVEDDNGGEWTLLRHAIDVEYDGHLQSGGPLHADVTMFLLARGADPTRKGPRGVPAGAE